MGWGGRWERGSGWGTHINPWLIHVNVWQKPLQHCKVISLQLIQINEKKKSIRDKKKLNNLLYRKEIKFEDKNPPTKQSTKSFPQEKQ